MLSEVHIYAPGILTNEAIHCLNRLWAATVSIYLD